MRKTNRKVKKAIRYIKSGYKVFAVFSSLIILYAIIAYVCQFFGHPIQVNVSSNTFDESGIEEMETDSHGNVLATEPCIELEDGLIVVYLERTSETYRQHLGYSMTGVGPVQVYKQGYLYHETYEEYKTLPKMQIKLNDDSFVDALQYKKDGKVMLRLRFDIEKAQDSCVYKKTSVSVVLDIRLPKGYL